MSFHIKKAEFEEAINAWKNMRKVLLEEGEKQVECINGMIRTGWEGFTAQDTADTGRKFMTDGVYAQAYDMTDKLCNIMDGAVPRMNALMKMCENLGEYFMYDEYEETVYTEIEEGDYILTKIYSSTLQY